mmetsp:Transcript_5280/g.10832  ORF Transcript_5280/g.10832 Transcript_5280/m.10832 type:complete len:372 (-) Transcript_5280:2573-3688(-)
MEEVRVEHVVMDVVMHDNVDNVLAVGLVTGEVEVWDRVRGRRWGVTAHKGYAVRAVGFVADNALASVGSDGRVVLLDGERGNIKRSGGESGVHEPVPINAMVALSDTVLATGSDNGVVQLWDWRSPSSALSIRGTVAEQEDYIADMKAEFDHRKLLAVAGGFLGVYDWAMPRGHLSLHALSDDVEDELLSLSIVKSGKKVVCGSMEGVLQIFSWDEWGDVSDRFPGHPKSVECVVKVDEDTILTGSSDGLIRLVQILPNTFGGVVAEHGALPVERMSLDAKHKILASCSHDNLIRFHDLSILQDDSDSDIDPEEESRGQRGISSSTHISKGMKERAATRNSSLRVPQDGRRSNKRRRKPTVASDPDFFDGL